MLAAIKNLLGLVPLLNDIWEWFKTKYEEYEQEKKYQKEIDTRKKDKEVIEHVKETKNTCEMEKLYDPSVDCNKQ